MDNDQVEIMKSNSWADEVFEQAKAHQECYIAGMQAADENSPSARKLAALIAAVEETLTFLRPVDNGFPRNAHCARAKLREALIEARKP